jgi:murein DD-endopeptidase MepM/ murein hydrolase activator NlpD
MQIILVHPRLARAKSVMLKQTHIWAALFGAALLMLVSALCLNWMLARFGEGVNLPFLPDRLAFSGQDNLTNKEKFMRENLTVMAVKLGEMQAQLERLDALGERVQGLAGVKPEEFNFKDKPARGGAEPSHTTGAHVLDMAELQTALSTLVRDVEHRSDYLNVVETALMGDKIKSKLLPTIQPVNVSYNASGFGWRLDPFNGHSAFHEGIDFPSAVGTPILAAAGGVVIAAEYHPQFGNMIDIDHGNGIVTRYAHASKLHVKLGDITRRGQHIADIGSTGRSTGAHLHFEVHVNGVPQNPHKFLSAGANQGKIAALAFK